MDIRVPLACVLLAGGMLGLAMPTITETDATVPDRVGTSASAVNDTPSLATLNTEVTPVTWANEVQLQREYDGHFYADVAVDGISTRMMVDTGASVIALTGEDAMALGLYWDESEIAPVAEGASGVVYGVHTQLRHVAVGGFEARNVRAMIVPEGLGVSLLGQSFLSTVNSVEIADDRMVLEN